jgi:hypothetical protein
MCRRPLDPLNDCADLAQIYCRNGDVSSVGDSRGDNGVVVVVRLRHSRHGRCTCGWVGKRHLLRSAAVVDALLHAAQNGCAPAMPLAEWKLIPPEEAPGLDGWETAIPCGAAVLVPNGRA